MSYAGRRWLKIGVVPSPEALRQASRLAEAIEQTPVPIGQRSRDADEVYDAYRAALMGVPGRFAYDLAGDGDDFTRRPCTDGRQEYLHRLRPVVHLSRGSLYFRAPDVLCVAGNGEPLHLELCFPETYAQGPDWSVVHATDGTPNRALYEAMREVLLRGTRPLTVVGPTRQWRLPVRYAPEMRDWIAARPVIQDNGLWIK